MQSFVGREHELGLLDERLDAAATGHPQTVVVEGPAGIGRSALLAAFAARVGPDRLLTASGDEDETFLAYGLVQQLTGLPTRTWDDPFVAGADLLRLLDDRSGGGPTVLVVDDAHLADTASLRALTFALRRLRADPVLTVVATAEDDVARLPKGLLRLADADDNRLRLTGLSDREVADLLREHGHGPLPRTVARLREHTGGNPLHLGTLLAEAPAAALADDASTLPAPASFGRAVLGQLAGLTPAAQELARAAAVLADDSPLAVVAAVAGRSPQDADATERAAEELGRSGLARGRRGADGWTLRFRHPLVRAAVADDLGPATRTALHRRAAEHLTGDDALAHRVVAATGPEPELSDLLACRAAELLGAGHTHRAAELMLDAARTASPGAATEERLVEALNLFLMDGDLSSAKGLGTAVEGLPGSAQRLYLRAKVAWLAGRPTDAETLAREAWSLGADLESDRRGGLAAILAQLCNLRGDGDEAAAWSEQALALDLPPDLVDSTQAARALGLTLAGQVHRAVAGLADGTDEDVRSHSHRLTARGALRLATDDVAGARRDLSLVCDAGGLLWPQRLVAMGVLAELEFRAGRWDASLDLAEQAVSLAEDSEQEWVLGYLHSTAVLTTAARGDWDGAAAHVAAGERLVAELGDPATMAVCANAAVHLASCRGDPETVVLVSESLHALGGPPVREPGFLDWPTQYVGALLDLGRDEEATELLADFEATARERGCASRLAALARLRGEIATARRAHGEARAAFDEALSSEHAAALEGALTQAAYGRFLRRRGERRAAVVRLETAHRKLLALGAAPFVRRCEDELAACGVSPAEPGPAVAVALTPQERTVAGLACRGLTNADIARELVLSAKTVGYHLGNVYTKLDVHSRAQLVAAWHDRGAVPVSPGSPTPR